MASRRVAAHAHVELAFGHAAVNAAAVRRLRTVQQAAARGTHAHASSVSARGQPRHLLAVSDQPGRLLRRIVRAAEQELEPPLALLRVAKAHAGEDHQAHADRGHSRAGRAAQPERIQTARARVVARGVDEGGREEADGERGCRDRRQSRVRDGEAAGRPARVREAPEQRDRGERARDPSAQQRHGNVLGGARGLGDELGGFGDGACDPEQERADHRDVDRPLLGERAGREGGAARQQEATQGERVHSSREGHRLAARERGALGGCGDNAAEEEGDGGAHHQAGNRLAEEHALAENREQRRRCVRRRVRRDAVRGKHARASPRAHDPEHGRGGRGAEHLHRERTRCAPIERQRDHEARQHHDRLHEEDRERELGAEPRAKDERRVCGEHARAHRRAERAR
eukprot:CAMPEP_0119406416 /NCGR_PEP_ID=MMETSP1335-20130426/749_1 /TAXON_ID=259385 /ORGANISM="Chrysoculter rhomboideus, Strain RCC1486" /LENGTH=399 /DNA_ID=CAMNT_0007430495 /DNA_START=420 /DNA_END=1615 /DNA_ORIENTATION=+